MKRRCNTKERDQPQSRHPRQTPQRRLARGLPSQSPPRLRRDCPGDMLMKTEYRQSGQPRDNGGMTLTPSCANPPTLSLSATAGSAAPSKETTLPGKSHSCGNDTQAPRSFRTSAADSTSGEKDLYPYWSDFTEAISSKLWLPIETGLPGSDSSSSSGLSNRTAAGSWFSTTRITAPNRNSLKIFSPSSTPSVADSTACAGTETQSRRSRVYPAKARHRTLRMWFNAARWCYNETIARLKRTGEAANWKAVLIVRILPSSTYRLRSEMDTASVYPSSSLRASSASSSLTRASAASLASCSASLASLSCSKVGISRPVRGSRQRSSPCSHRTRRPNAAL